MINQLVSLMLLITCSFSLAKGQVNFLNPSFEDTVTGFFRSPPNWEICGNSSPDLFPITTFPTIAPSDSNTFLGLTAAFTFFESVSQTLPSKLKKDTSYCFSIDIASMPPAQSGGNMGRISIYLGDSSCNYDQLIYTSGTIDTLWNSYTVRFTPDADYDYFTIRSVAIPPGGYVYVDNLSDYGCDTTMVRVMEEREPITNAIKAFPNPTSDRVKLQWDVPNAQAIQIYNNLGQLVQTIELNEQQLLELDVQNLASGLYHVTLHTATDKYFTNFVIVK